MNPAISMSPRRSARFGKDRHLDVARLLERRDVAVLLELLVDGVPQDPERGEQVLLRGRRIHREGEDVLVVADGDRGETLGPEAPLELRVHAGGREVHDDHALVHDPLDRRVGRRR